MHISKSFSEFCVIVIAFIVCLNSSTAFAQQPTTTGGPTRTEFFDNFRIRPPNATTSDLIVIVLSIRLGDNELLGETEVEVKFEGNKVLITASAEVTLGGIIFTPARTESVPVEIGTLPPGEYEAILLNPRPRSQPFTVILDPSVRTICIASLEGRSIDPDQEGGGIGAIIPVGEALFRQRAGEGARAEFEVINVALSCGTRLDVCLQNTDETLPDLLLQQISLCDIANLAVGRAEVDERNGDSVLDPIPDFEVTPLSTLVGNATNICNAVVGRTLRVRRSESRRSPCNEDIVLEGVIENTERSFFP